LNTMCFHIGPPGTFEKQMGIRTPGHPSARPYPNPKKTNTKYPASAKQRLVTSPDV
jgi:hypothetical protein